MSSDAALQVERRSGAGAGPTRRGEAGATPRAGRRDLKPLGVLWPFVRAHWTDAALAGVFLVVSTASALSFSFAARALADIALASHTAGAIDRAFLLMAAVVVVLAFATAGRFFFISKLGERVTADLRGAVYANVVGLDQAYFLDIRTGEVISRLTTDLTIVESMVGSSVSVALRNLLTAAGALLVLAIVDPGFTALVALLAAFTMAPLIMFGRRVRRLSARAQERFAKAMGYAGETLEALDTVQAFGRERSAAARFKGAVEEAYRASMARVSARAIMTALVMLLIGGAVGSVLWRASIAAFVDHTMTPGALLQFVFLSVVGAGAVGSLGETWGDVQKTSGAMERIGELLNAKSNIRAPASPVPLPTPARGELAFENVVFAYPGRPDLPALKGFDLHVRPGERIALVGPSGAGKSTVFRLLLRFYDPQVGSVRIDGVDLRQADPGEVRARLAVVAQDAPLFSGSAIDNLRFGDERATREALVAAAVAAQANQFLLALPSGFDTPLGERGKTLSGGERQRLALARALVRAAPILLLDEATSALDAENEQLVQRALSAAASGRTSVIIAHRLATVLAADRIVVMDEGRVIDIGAHRELMARGGLYARLAELQFQTRAA
ncbi:MAG TPA: ABC transporter transmembrane domain-containing protein [Caulobacteraceae bacterium]